MTKCWTIPLCNLVKAKSHSKKKKFVPKYLFVAWFLSVCVFFFFQINCGLVWTVAGIQREPQRRKHFLRHSHVSHPAHNFKKTTTPRNTKGCSAAVIWSLYLRMLCLFINLASVQMCIRLGESCAGYLALWFDSTADWLIGGNPEITATPLSSKRPLSRSFEQDMAEWESLLWNESDGLLFKANASRFLCLVAAWEVTHG